MEDIVDVILTKEEKDKLEVAQNTKSKETVDNTSIPDLNISFYFANDNTTFPLENYENGLKNLLILLNQIERINYTDCFNG